MKTLILAMSKTKPIAFSFASWMDVNMLPYLMVAASDLDLEYFIEQ